jgi:hypothetical protein
MVNALERRGWTLTLTTIAQDGVAHGFHMGGGREGLLQRTSEPMAT